MSSPQGVVRLLDCLGEREVVRNEALLLAVRLTAANAEAAKIAAFEGAFDRVFAIARQAGASSEHWIDCSEFLFCILDVDICWVTHREDDASGFSL